MITEYAQILEIDVNRIKVAIRSSSGCGACSAKSGCGNGILDRWLNPSHVLWLDSDAEFCSSSSVGENLRVGVDENAFVRNALTLYLIPILMFLAVAGIGYQLQGEFFSIVGGLIGLLLGAVVVRYLVRHSPYAKGFTPRIVDRAATEFFSTSESTS